MVKAEWNGAVIAQSDATIMVEGNHYFPRESVNPEFLTESSTKTTCPWKGVASYYSLSVDGKLNADAAWYYPDPFAAAAQIKDHIAFWRGVSVS
ncbi:MAG: DUF427 domain-containing protein [Sphingomonadales bacterium]|jgi:uncharacterized protein (DUF427 family)|nr:MAG: DUF427 domain-containing protein [Sphingomonadales bacterium]